MKTKSSCEKGRNLDQHRVEAQVGDGLMNWGYSMELGKRAFVFLVRFFGMPIIIESTHQGPTKNWANRIALAHGEVGGDVGVLSTAFLKARWAEDCDMCTEGTKVEIINRLGFVERALAAS